MDLIKLLSASKSSTEIEAKDGGIRQYIQTTR